MSVNWTNLCAAFALYLVLEGIYPFLNPQGLKRTLLAVTEVRDGAMRMFGLASMLSGLCLLYFIQR